MVGEPERTFHDEDKIYDAALAVKLTADRGLEFPSKRKRTLIVGDIAFYKLITYSHGLCCLL